MHVICTGAVTTLAGSATSSWLDGVGAAVRFNLPRGLALDSNGAIYVADDVNARIRKSTSAGRVVKSCRLWAMGYGLCHCKPQSACSIHW